MPALSFKLDSHNIFSVLCWSYERGKANYLEYKFPLLLRFCKDFSCFGYKLDTTASLHQTTSLRRINDNHFPWKRSLTIHLFIWFHFSAEHHDFWIQINTGCLNSGIEKKEMAFVLNLVTYCMELDLVCATVPKQSRKIILHDSRRKLLNYF